MTAAELYEMLKKAQEPKGFFFNKDKDWTLSILADLLVNKERYGYTSCPCRLASGDREKDATSSAPVCTAPMTSGNTEAAIATCMFPASGMTAKFLTSMSRKGAQRKRSPFNGPDSFSLPVKVVTGGLFYRKTLTNNSSFNKLRPIF